MQRPALFMALPILLVVVFLGCPRKQLDGGGPVTTTPQAGEHRAALAVVCREDRDCFHPSNKESKPQSPYYQGGCLEQVRSLEVMGHNPIPLSFFTGRAQDGVTRPEWTVQGHHQDGGTVELKLTPYTDQGLSLAGVQLYQVKHRGQPLCGNMKDEIIEVDPRNAHGPRALALAVPGYWEAGKWQPSNQFFTLSCLAGVVAKCVLWGYAPWKESGGKSLGPHHNACVQAARARYLEDSKDPAFTCQKTTVDVYDSQRIQLQGNDAGFEFESLWGESGLICLRHPRWQGCAAKLAAGGIHPDAGCPDPEDGDTGWPDGGLIAIRSASNITGNGKCPTEDDALCPECQAR